jgi:ATPase components of ABC transporters with duplicated ATPase domains
MERSGRIERERKKEIEKEKERKREKERKKDRDRERKKKKERAKERKRWRKKERERGREREQTPRAVVVNHTFCLEGGKQLAIEWGCQYHVVFWRPAAIYGCYGQEVAT